MLRWAYVLILGFLSAAVAAGNDPVYAVPDADRNRSDLASLTVPESLDVEMVDGIEYRGLRSLFRKGGAQLKVLPGMREIALRYNQLFETGADSHEFLKSKIIVLRFQAEPGGSYRASHPKFRDVSAARKAMPNFAVSIEDAQGANRVLSASQVQQDWRGEQTMTSRPDLVGNVDPKPAEAAAATPSTAAGVRSLDLLKFAWQGASAADRAAFLEWAKSAP